MSLGILGRPPVAPEQRFWSKVKPIESGCWEWQGMLDKHGYGLFWLSEVPGEKPKCFAHRFSYQINIAPIPDGLQLDHLCRNHKCVHPLHLQAVTQQVNILRGMGLSAQAIRTGKCLRGHDYTPENTVADKDGSRSCKICRRDVTRKWWAKHGKEWRRARITNSSSA